MTETARSAMTQATNRPDFSRVRFPQMDALRGLASAWVVLFHARAGQHLELLASSWPRFVDWFIAHGDLGVSVFFVVSGFVIAHSTGTDHVSFAYARRLLARRWLRLSPPYWASIALVLALGALSARFVPGKAFELPSLGRLGAHLFYLQDLLRMPALSSVYWTLCLEVQFYVTFYVLMLLVSALRRRVADAVAYVCVFGPALFLSNLWPLGLAPFELLGSFFGQWHLFLLGALLWRASVVRAAQKLLTCLTVGELVVLGGAALVRHDLTLGAGVLTGILILTTAQNPRLSALWSLRPLQTLGLISYSLYLTHNPITGAVFRVGYRLTGHSKGAEALWLVISVATCLAVAYGLHLAVERPAIRVSRKLRPPADPGPQAARSAGLSR